MPATLNAEGGAHLQTVGPVQAPRSTDPVIIASRDSPLSWSLYYDGIPAARSTSFPLAYAPGATVSLGGGGFVERTGPKAKQRQKRVNATRRNQPKLVAEVRCHGGQRSFVFVDSTTTMRADCCWCGHRRHNHRSRRVPASYYTTTLLLRGGIVVVSRK